MSCIDEQTVEFVLKTLDEKYNNYVKTPATTSITYYECQVKNIFPKEYVDEMSNDILSALNMSNATSFFDYDQFIQTICILMPDQPTGGDPELIEYEKPAYFSFSSKDLKTDITALGWFLFAISVIYLGIFRIDKFNETIIKTELNLYISYTDVIFFKAFWATVKGHNFCETIANNIVNKAIQLGIATTESALQNCWTFNPRSNSLALAASAIESWIAPQSTLECIKDYGRLHFEAMRIDLKYKAISLPLGFFYLIKGLVIGSRCTVYFAYRLGFQKVIDRLQYNVESIEPSSIRGGYPAKSKKNRKHKKKTKKNRRKSKRTRK